jgi:macrolide transport system ATP-binding/permease protein
MGQDIAYAFRQLRKSPGFTLIVILTIALGIGANTAVFSVINGYLRPLPVRLPDQIVVLAADTKGDETGFQYRLSFPALQELRRETSTFSDVFAFEVGISGLSSDGKTSQILYSVVTGNYFPALGLRPAAGRFFVTGEGEHPGAESLIVLGYNYWQKRFGGAPGVVGKQVRVDGLTARVIGVAPKEFHGTYGGADMDAYMPLDQFAKMPFWASPTQVYTDRSRHPITVLARLRAGVSIERAQRAVDVFARRLASEYPATDSGIGIRVIAENLARPLPLKMLAGVVPLVRGFVLALGGLVLLLACMNVANLLLVRATVRQRELAIRAALGSGRSRLLRQLLTESLLLAFAGAAAGVLMGKWGKDAFASAIDLGVDLPTILDFAFDWRVFAYALAAAVFTGVVIGLWPAWRASATDANLVLHEGRGDSGGGGSPSRQRARSTLVAAQVAGSLLLLIIAGLFVRSLDRAQRMNLGFNPDHVLNVLLDTREAGYDRPRTLAFYRELERRLKELPGTQSVSLAFSSPLGYISHSEFVYVDGRTLRSDEQPPMVGANSVSSSYFDTLQLPLARGRGFTEQDTESTRLVAVVNETMAARFWPGQDAIGRRFRTATSDGPVWEVVGIARNSKYVAVAEGALPYFYRPLTQQYSSMRVLQVRTAEPPERMAAVVRRQIEDLDADLPVSDLRPMKQSMNGPAGFLVFRLGAMQASAMGLLGTLLAILGVYGVVSYGAAQRTHEIGIRLALGAQPGDIRRLVLRQGLAVVCAGIAAGLVGAFALARLTGKILLLVSSTDPLTFAGVTLLLAAIALWACYLPARRAMRVDPLVALRHE